MSNLSQDIISNSGVRIFQDKQLYSFNLDTILLYNFAKPAKKGTVVDLCSGNGAIGLTLTQKTKATIYLVELQKKLSDLAQMGIKENNLVDQVIPINDDLKNIQNYISHDTVDSIVCNPPYFTVENNSKIKDNPVLAIARHEIKTDLFKVLITAKVLLKENSHLFMVYRPERLSELFKDMLDNRLQPKRIRFVRSTKRKNANLVLVDAIKTVKSASLKIEPDLVVYQDGEFTKEAKSIIEG
ncbi:tRNA1(Val) (adenine(37)-N6)-methyltransferase [Companilactobacillus keshanensis]|uniref:tRNA1(Val) (Adenine(37)-N6)-methyltransferase n=1 Tax=Companilactobacillus keshanensis TaxID=2486003 RepID=A0ABW4BR52_9LACO|nr:tRNA1(Val) (adenine(37)-N6)-methyltransferase [Companilactobacillus keshanensis]